MTLPVRAAIYAAVIIAGGIAAGVGIVSGDIIDQVALILMGVLGIGGGGTAIRNLREPTTEMVVSVQDVIAALQADDSEPGKHRADGSQPTVLDHIGTTVAEIRSRADEVRARYGAQ